MALFRKTPEPQVDAAAHYRKALLQASRQNLDEELEQKFTAASFELDREIETQLESEMALPVETKTVPNALIDHHIEQIKDLSSRADDFEKEAKRLLTLAKEHRLGAAALEAANRVLSDGLQGKAAPGLPTAGVSFPASGLVSQNLPDNGGH